MDAVRVDAGLDEVDVFGPEQHLAGFAELFQSRPESCAAKGHDMLGAKDCTSHWLFKVSIFIHYPQALLYMGSEPRMAAT